MRRRLPSTLVLAAGMLLLLDLLIINPWLGAAAGVLQELLVLLAAGAALAGGLALAVRHLGDLAARRGDRLGSIVLLAGMAAMLFAGLRPGSVGAGDPALRWLVAALLAPLSAAIVALVFVFLLTAIHRGRSPRSAETTVLLLGAAAVVVLLLPIGGAPGAWLGGVAAWVQDVPLAGVFRGLLLGVGIIGAVTAARLLLGLSADE